MNIFLREITKNKVHFNITEGYNAPFSTKTDSAGYFKLKKESQNYGDLLIFKKKGYKEDSVRLIRGEHSGKIYILFLREESDTLFKKKK